jgi:MFS family permease
MCCFQLVFGKIYTVFSLKWGYISAILIFEIGSAVCATAPNSTALIIGRAIAGLGCAGLASGALIILANSVPLNRRPIYAGIIGSMFGIASVCGPPLGGALTSHLSWRWCFYINLPIGVITVLLLGFFFHPRQGELKTGTIREKLEDFDFVSLPFLFPGIISTLLGLQWGGSAYPWRSWRIVLLLCIAGVLFVCFIFIQLQRGDKATLPPRIASQRSVACGSIAALSIGAAFLTLIYFVPLYFQVIKGVSAARSGVMILPIVISDVIFSITAGVLG